MCWKWAAWGRGRFAPCTWPIGGADVVSVVRQPEGRAITSTLLNRGKRSVFADLQSPEGCALVLVQLVEQGAKAVWRQ